LLATDTEGGVIQQRFAHGNLSGPRLRGASAPERQRVDGGVTLRLEKKPSSRKLIGPSRKTVPGPGKLTPGPGVAVPVLDAET
jgi:hypothetical protein